MIAEHENEDHLVYKQSMAGSFFIHVFCITFGNFFLLLPGVVFLNFVRVRGCFVIQTPFTETWNAKQNRTLAELC